MPNTPLSTGFIVSTVLRGRVEVTDHQAATHPPTVTSAKPCRAGQLALAWVLAQGDDVAAIPGTKRIKYLDENLAAARVQLGQEDLKEIAKFLESIKVGG